MLDIGFQEIIIIFVVALIVIGPKQLPEFSKKLGKWILEIRKGVNLAKSQITEEINKDIQISGERSGTTAHPLREDGERDDVMSEHNVAEEKT